jgi:hypothetical protein
MQESDDQDLITLALDFANAHEHFDSSFIISLGESLERYQKLTDKQRAALEKIIDKWHMQEWADKHN